jgi:ribonuclease HI
VLQEAFIITDGSSGANGDGGYGAIVATPYFGVELWGYGSDTTNNRMEMMAALKGMQFLPESHLVSLISDSAYLLNTLKNEWYVKWFSDEGKSDYQRPNIDLWHQLVQEIQRHKMTYIKVKGHNGHEHNERVDKLAVQARKEKLSGIEWLYGEYTGS